MTSTSYAEGRTKNCQYLDRVHCDKCPGPIILNCGGQVHFAELSAIPQKVSVSFRPSDSIRSGEVGAKYYEGFKNIVERVRANGGGLEGNDDDQTHFIRGGGLKGTQLFMPIEVSSDSSGIKTIGGFSDPQPQNEQRVRRWIKKHIVTQDLPVITGEKGGVPLIENFRTSQNAYLSVYTKVIDFESLKITSFEMSESDLHGLPTGSKGEFCWHDGDPPPQVIGLASIDFDEERKKCETENDDGCSSLSKQNIDKSEECYEEYKNFRFCFSKIRCVKNGIYEESYNTCKTENDNCPSAKECKNNPKLRVEEIHPKNKDSLSSRAVSINKKLKRALEEGYGFSGDNYYLPPRLINLNNEPSWGSKIRSFVGLDAPVCRICVAPVILNGFTGNARSTVACMAQRSDQNFCPHSVEKCTGDTRIRMRDLANLNEVDGTSFILEEDKTVEGSSLGEGVGSEE